MTHEPECFLGGPCRSNGGKEHVPQGTVAGFPVTICGLCMYDCICISLRAAYQRGRDGVFGDDWVDSLSREFHKGYTAGYNDHARSRAKAEAMYGTYTQEGK
jgi:hypothetical protein